MPLYTAPFFYCSQYYKRTHIPSIITSVLILFLIEISQFGLHLCYWLIDCDCQLKVGWGTDSSYTNVLDFTTIPFTVFVSNSHLIYPRLNFENDIFWCNYFVFFKNSIRFFIQLLCTTFNDYFKTNPGVKDLPWPGIEPQSHSPQQVVIAMRFNDLIPYLLR